MIVLDRAGVVVDCESADACRQRLRFERTILQQARQPGDILTDEQIEDVVAGRGWLTVRLTPFAVLSSEERVSVDRATASYELDLAARVFAEARGEPRLEADWRRADIESAVRADFLDESDDPEDRWGALLRALRSRGVTADADDLEAAPFSIEFTSDAVARLSP